MNKIISLNDFKNEKEMVQFYIDMNENITHSNEDIDKAKKYAEGKVADALSQVVADAYLAGYNAGYQDGIGKVAKDSVSEETEFVDLGLPSGTLWASDYVKDGDEVLFLPYPEALKYDIPTKEQVDELREYCEISIK